MNFKYKVLSHQDLSDYCCICRDLEIDLEYFYLSGVKNLDTFGIIVTNNGTVAAELVFEVIRNKGICKLLLLCSKELKGGAGTFAMNTFHQLLKKEFPEIIIVLLYPEDTAISFYQK